MKSFKKLTSLTLVILLLVAVVTIASGNISAAVDDAATDASYYLVGYFDGVDIGDEGSANQGYAMVDGQVTVTVKNIAYVCVKNNDSLWYMTDGWLGDNITSATLYRTDDTSIAQFDKLSIPKGTYTFTVTENSDGTVTLSYAPATNVPPVPAEGYSLIGQFDGVMVGDGDDYASPGYAMPGGKVTVTVESVAYVCVKDNYQLWYMTDGWLGFDATTATLYSAANTSITQFDKLYVPAGTYTFTLLENSDGTLTLSYAKSIAQVKGYSISLGDNIAVNYYMDLADEVRADENAEMVFTVPNGGSTYEVRIPVSSVTPDANGYYVFTCEVAAKEMASKIAAQIVTSDKESNVFEYLVNQYAEDILAKAEEANDLVGGGIAGGDGTSNLLTPEMLSYVRAAPLVKAMLNYGANAQLYFNHNTDNLANAALDEADKALVDNLDLSEYNVPVTGSEEGVVFYGGALSLKSETAIKLYFIIEDGTAIPEVTVNGEKAELTKNGTLYELKISDIPVHKLNEMFEVKVGGLTLSYGAFSYGYQAMNTGKEALVNTIKALYAYNQKAIEYLG